LGSPSDNSDVLNSFKSLGKKGKEITSSLDNGLSGVSKCNFYRLENFGGKSVPRIEV
jgi:hypothetical protein